MKRSLYAVALLIIVTCVSHANAQTMQIVTTKTLHDFVGTWDGLFCSTDKPDFYRITIQPSGAASIHFLNWGSTYSTVVPATVESGTLDVSLPNGPDKETPMTLELRLSFYDGQPVTLVGGQAILHYTRSHYAEGPNTTMAQVSSGTLEDYGAKYAKICDR